MLKKVFKALLLVFVTNLVYKIFIYEQPVPKVDKHAYWGAGEPKSDDPVIKPFKIQVPESALQDLKTRLNLETRYQKSLEGVNFEYGFNPKALLEIVDFWKNKYDWRQREALLNSVPQFTTYVSGLRIHFIHVKPEKVPAGVKVVPLLLLHGWPGTVKEFYPVIPLLTTPREGFDFVFEVIIPSLPGYGFSEAAHKQHLSTPQIAVIFKKLMSRLGHNKFYLQGGDWGSFIATDLSILYPERAMSNKANLYLIAASIYPTLFMDQEIADRLYPLSDMFANMMLEMGHMHIHATKPDTLGVALTNTPVGLAAYILEKFSTWTNQAYRNRADGGLTEKFKLEDLLDNIMIYWFSGNVASALRIYSETFNRKHSREGWNDVPCKVPTVCARFPNELINQPEFIVRIKYPNLLPSSEGDYEVHRPPRGGHFSAFEEPELLVNSVFKVVLSRSSVQLYRLETTAAMAYTWDNRVKFVVRFMYDIDNNGYLDKNDFECLALRATLLEARGEYSAQRFAENQKIMQNLWSEIAELADFNKDGLVTVDEFKTAVKKTCVSKTYSQFPQAMKAFIDSHFKSIDINADGVIGPEEYRVDCVSRSAFTTVDQLDEAFNKLLNDNDKKIGGINLARYQELYAQFIGDANEANPAVYLFGPLTELS
ncbi:Hypothetical predicted protein [Cloeon dipterum]|uniref:EF-hand domain-containing protein n=2 Tax=Cloeon dipterum TaxID=197152 RepID=A0A8S1DQ02_9INSE|nr:Hypothetical predicted protein [Cloeon dipterum]